jgi:hypothetical protein
VGIVAHRLEPFVTGALFARVADETVTGLLMCPDDGEAHRMARTLEDVEVELVDLARARGRGEISRGEWSAAREGFALRAEELRETLALLAVADIATLRDLPQRWPSLGLPVKRAILTAVFARIAVHRRRSHGKYSSRIKLQWREPVVVGS